MSRTRSGFLFLALCAPAPLLGACARESRGLFPHSMKGYELYSFKVGPDWNYTLLTASNREKTFAEISSSDGFIDRGGLTKITARGADKLAGILSLRLPKGEEIVWRSSTPKGVSLPPASDVDLVKKSAKTRELRLEMD